MMTKKVVTSADAPKPIGPYSQAIETNGFIFLAGQTGINPETGNVAEGLASQTNQCLKNVCGVLKAMGLDSSAIVKTTCYLTDMANFAEFNEVYGKYFQSDFPARTTIAVKQLPLNALVEIEAIAINNR